MVCHQQQVAVVLLLFLLSLSHEASSQLAPSETYLSAITRPTYFHQKSADELFDRVNAQKAIQDLLFNSPRPVVASSSSSSDVCLQDLFVIASAAKSGADWAKKYIDSQAVKPSGTMNGNNLWYGDYDECLSIPALNLSASINFSPQYCRMGATGPNTTLIPPNLFEQFPGLMVGVCISSNCDVQDLISYLNPLVANLSLVVNPHLSHCVDTDLPYSTTFYITLAIFSIIGVFLFAGLAVDVWIQLSEWWTVQKRIALAKKHDEQLLDDDDDERDPEVPTFENIHSDHRHQHVQESIITVPSTSEMHNNKPPARSLKLFGQIFSPYYSFVKILAVPVPDEDQTSKIPNLNGMNAIRALSLFWVILGHVYAFSYNYFDNIGMMAQLADRVTMMFVFAGFYAVDTFLFLSGFFAYWSLAPKLKPDRTFWKSLPMVYLNRYIRLTPPAAAIILIDLGLWAYFYTGPFYFQREDSFCVNNWWTNMLYVNNFVNANQQCVGWTWYLSVDTQMFLLVPFAVVLFVWRPRYGWLLTWAGLLIQAAIATSLTFKYNLPGMAIPPLNNASLATARDYTDYYTMMYVPFYTRMGPYIVGVMCAHLVVKEAAFLKKHVFSNVYLQGLLWAIMFATMLALTYGQYPLVNGEYLEPLWLAAIYNSVARTAWGFALGWLVIAAVFNHAGPIGGFLNWPVWALPARLSYAGYLLHPFVILFFMQASRRPFNGQDINYIFWFFSCTIATLLISLPFSLAFESPVVGLQRLFLKK